MLNNAGTQTIETQRLVLRKFEFPDGEAMLKYWVSDPLVQHRYCEPVYSTKPEVDELLEKYISSYEKPHYYRWAIILKETNECVGQIAYFLVDEKNHFAEIEYCIGTLFQKKGLTPEAVKAVIKYGFDKINLHKVQVCHHSSNTPSKKVIEKCGFVYEGTLRDFFFEDEKYYDRLYYSILKSEYKNT